jgi:predicted alpha/beta-hydrolase family hydrolase
VTERVVHTPVGDVRLVTSKAVGTTRAVLALGHGAGGGIEARDLVALATALPADGITVVRVEQPWRLAGKKVAAPPATLDKAWVAALSTGSSRRGTPLVVGGRSAGARVACRTAGQLGALAVVALAFPLHPPGRAERSRAPELLQAGVPTLVVQGERDPFGGPAEIPAGPHVVPIAGADHGFKVPASAALSQAQALEELTAAVRTWLDEVLTGS